MPFDYTGSFSGSFTGDITSTNGVISSSAQVVSNLPSGVVSASSQIDYRTIQNKPATISAFQKNSIVANNNFRENIYPNDSASFDSRINGVGTDITALDARIDALSVGSGSADWATITNIPSGLVSGSSQITNVVTDTYISASAAASGFGQGGSSTDISALNTFTGSIQSEVDSLTAATSSYLTSLPSGLVSGSSQITDVITDSYISSSAAASGFGTGGGTSDFTQLTNVPSGLVSGSTQITDVVTDSYISASAAASGFGQGGGETYTAGNGISIISNLISIDTSSTHFRLGVSGAAASYGFGGGGGGSFGDPPTFDQDGLQVNEFVTSGSTIATLTVTDVTPGDTATFEIQSSYTDDFFKISSGGVVTANTLVTSSMNTTAGSGSNDAHPFLVKVTDGQNNVVEETIYIYVRPNSAPVFRQTSVGGSIITSFTASANENSTNGSTLGTIYFTDVNSDTITIGTGSIPSELSVTINATNVVITQNTASFDYETITAYNLTITASDEHYQSGDDDDSISYIPVLINIVDNDPPIVNNQTLTAINENSSNGTVVDSVVATDAESDTITWGNFTLLSAYMDGVGTNVTSSLGGTSLYDPHPNPFQIDSSNGQVTRKTGMYLNSDVANRYQYRVTVTDIFNTDTGSGVITIPITDDAASSIGTDGNTYYILESAVQGDNLTYSANGYTVSNVTVSSVAEQMWEVNTIPSGYVRFTNGLNHQTGSSATLEVDTHISGNLFFADGDTVQVQITASERFFETTKQYRDHTLTITDNQPYSIVFSDTSANLNTNGARPSNTLTTITFTEPQSGIGDTVEHDAFVFTDPSGQLTASRSSDTYYVQPLSNLSGSTTYDFTASIADSYGNITTDSHSIVIAQAPTGTLSENGTFYVIESATNGDNIVLGTNGRTGTQGDLGVSYSPQYNSAAVTSFTSSNAQISVNSSGNLTVGTNISGSVNIYPGTITSDITWRDQYDNVGGSQTITVNLAINNAPSAAELTSTNRNTNQATDGNLLSTIKWTDTESDALNISSFALTGAGASNLSSSYDGSNNFGLYADGDQSAGTISFTASIQDIHGFRTGVYTDDITIAQADDGTLTAPGNLFIIESATSGDGITNTTTGIGTAKTLSVTYSPSYGSPIAQNFTSDNPFIAVNSSTGVLTVGTDISGSGNTDGTTLTANIGWEDQYGNSDSAPITVSVTPNTAPSVTTDTPNTGNWNTNLAVDGALLATLVWGDTEGDALDVDTFNLTGAGAASLSSSYNGGNAFGIYANGDRSAGTISYTANLDDIHGFNTGTYSDSIVVSQAVGGSITSEDFYIIESALSGALVTTATNGIAGTQGDVNVTYSPNYGTQTAEQFRTLHAVVDIDSDGNLSVKSNISGSYTNGGTISPTIYWLDQYGNEGTGSITINVTNNVPATALFTNETLNAPVTSGTKLVTISISDTESNSPYSVTLSGAGADSMSLAPQNAASSSWFINASDNSMTAGVTLTYTASVSDSYGEITQYNNEFTVGAAPAGGALWYAYISLQGAYATTDETAALTMFENSSNPGSGPASGHLFDDLADGDIGTSTITSTVWTGTGVEYSYLVASGSTLTGSNTQFISELEELDQSYGSSGANANSLIIVFPSSSAIGVLPVAMENYVGAAADAGDYTLYGEVPAPGSDGGQVSYVKYYDLNSGTYPGSSDTRFGVIFTNGDAKQDVNYYFMATSGSAPANSR